MQDSFVRKVDELSPVRQGDILCRESREPPITGPLIRELGVVITADCDIAQAKMGPFYTYLSIVPASEYLEGFWAYEELQRLRLRHMEVALNLIHELDKQRDPNVAMLSSQDLRAWIGRSSAEEVANALGIKLERNKQAQQALTVLALLEKDHDKRTNLELLQECWRALGRSKANQLSAIEAAFDQRQMRSEYIFVPWLPGCDDRGFVIVLRDIRSVALNSVFGGMLAWKLRPSKEGMYRLGRFTDAFRYSVAQRLAVLFSRIGLSAEFEAECERVGEELAREHAPE